MCLSFWFYVQVVLIILAAAIGLALNVTVTEFVDTVCSRHILACMTPFVYIGIISCKKNNSARFKISRMITSNNGKAKFFYHEIMVVWHNTVLQCGKKWAWPSKHFLACAACGLLPPRSKNPSYAPAIDWAWIAYLGPTRYT